MKKVEKIKDYTGQSFLKKLFMFLGFKVVDVYKKIKNDKEFEEYGVTMYCGRQGAGKTMAMTEYLERMRLKYPKAIIVTNYGYKNQDHGFTDWQQFFEIRNGVDGVIFAIDEIQNEFSSMKWKNFPESLLQVITQQRKQRIKIVCTSQVFTRVAKPLREQCNDVVDCFTLGGRWTFTKCYDAVDYNNTIDSSEKNKLRLLYRKSFIQDNNLRNTFDSYQVVEKISNREFQSRADRLN